MAEVDQPAGETPAESGRRSARPADETVAEPAEERVATTTRRFETVATEPVAEPEERSVAREPAHAADRPAWEADPPAWEADPPVADRRPAPAVAAAPAEPVAAEPAAPVVPAPPVAPAPPVTRPLEPATDHVPAAPRTGGNRIVGIAWVLLAAGLFQVLFFAANALVALVFGGAPAVVPQLQSIAGTSLAWLPVLLFFLLFFLTVLIAGRAGRLFYVLTSLIVGAAVYVATVLLFSIIVRHALGDANTLAQTFLNWEFILVGLVARETMLWTGLAIGSRGIRVRRRNREARKRYEQEIADARA